MNESVNEYDAFADDLIQEEGDLAHAAIGLWGITLLRMTSLIHPQRYLARLTKTVSLQYTAANQIVLKQRRQGATNTSPPSNLKPAITGPGLRTIVPMPVFNR